MAGPVTVPERNEMTSSGGRPRCPFVLRNIASTIDSLSYVGVGVPASTVKKVSALG